MLEMGMRMRLWLLLMGLLMVLLLLVRLLLVRLLLVRLLLVLVIILRLGMLLREIRLWSPPRHSLHCRRISHWLRHGHGVWHRSGDRVALCVVRLCVRLRIRRLRVRLRLSSLSHLLRVAELLPRRRRHGVAFLVGLEPGPGDK